MALRDIIKIDEEKCDGCGLCTKACAEGAIQIINGKAKLISDVYCDGLGACIGPCPQDAITLEKRYAEDFDKEATKKHLAKQHNKETENFVCPGMMAKQFNTKSSTATHQGQEVPSLLSQWPIQLKLVPPNAPYFTNADLLLVADCTAFATGDFHNKFLKDHSIVIGCPKLDEAEFYIQKLAQIIKTNNLNTLTVIHMEVPCCSGLTYIAKKAIELAEEKMPLKDVTISLNGSIIKSTSD